jgi:flagellar protein FliL
MSEAAAVEAAAPANKGSKLPLILAIVGAVVIAGGGGAYFALSGKKDETAGTKEGADAEHAAPKLPAVYVKFDPPFVVNFEAKGLMRFLQVSIEVLTRDPATADMIKQHDPMLRNDLLMLLGSQTFETISTREGKEELRKEALAAVAKVIEKEGGDAKSVEQLYFTSFVMQ